MRQLKRLLAAFRRGDGAHLAWSKDPIEVFQIGRMLWKINWVARRQLQSLMNFVGRYVPVFESYEQTGQLHSPS